MIHVQCEICNRDDVPQNESLRIDGAIWCSTCIEKNFQPIEKLKKHKVEQRIDPTICGLCGKDNGHEEFAIMSRLPACPACTEYANNRPYPLGVKMMFIGTFVLVLFSFIYNYRFYEGYQELNSFAESWSEGDMDGSLAHINEVHRHVPESKDVESLWRIHNAVHLLQVDSAIAAARMLQEFDGNYDPSLGVDDLLLTVNRSAAFDRREYRAFLKYSEIAFDRDPDSPHTHAQMASAYACMYASTGEQHYCDSSRVHIEQGLSLSAAAGDPENDISEFVNRIEHRLHTRRIIAPSVFMKEYPYGWSAEEEM